MGSFYENMVAVDATAEAVIAALGSQPAFVAPEINGAVAVFHNDDGSTMPHAVAEPLSRDLGQTVLWFGVHDDDILSCEVWRSGALVAEVSVPDTGEYFGLGEAEMADAAEAAAELGFPTAENMGIEGYVGAVARGDAGRAREVLMGDYVFATDRHRDLLTAFDLPTWPAGWGHRYLLEYDGSSFDGPPLTPIGQD